MYTVLHFSAQAAEEEKVKRLNIEKKLEASQRQQQTHDEKVERYSSRVDAAQESRYLSPEILTSSPFLESQSMHCHRAEESGVFVN